MLYNPLVFHDLFEWQTIFGPVFQQLGYEISSSGTDVGRKAQIDSEIFNNIPGN